jgi:hypothetical protein
MKKLLEKITCKHDWKQLAAFENNRCGIFIGVKPPTYVKIVLTCAHCGKIKKLTGDKFVG